jgi:trk system potassium uptake protein TrkH
MHTVLPLLHVMGLLLTVFSLAYALPLLSALYYGDGTLAKFVTAWLVTLGSGAFTWLATYRFRRELRSRDGFLLVTLAWTGMAGFATIPLMLTLPELSFTDAFFETMSGLTTTGATVLTGLDNLQPSINLWRHELNWLGGMGIIVLAVAVLPLLGVGGMQLYKAETPGPMKESKLTPRITGTAKALWLVYFGITVACIVALRLAGMSWFDAVNHAFAAMSLGGFSTHDASVGFFDSPAIEFVLIVFMLVAGMNFATHFLAWHRRSLRVYAGDIEARAFLTLVLLSCVGVAAYLWWHGTYESFWTALRHASFNLVSIATDCGFASVDFDKWPVFAPLWMLFLSCLSVSTGSTGGGIKMFRTLLLVRQGLRELFLLLHPAAVNPLKIGGRTVPNSVVYSVLAFLALYFASVVALTFLLVGSGLDLTSSFSAIIACINNAGPGLNQVGPATNYAVLTDFQTWVCTLAMLLGRLEIFTLVVLFTPAFWRR